MTIYSFLRNADYVIGIALNLMILVWSFTAYRRTKLKAFGFWIWSYFGGIVLQIGMWLNGNNASHMRADDYRFFWELYRVGYILVTVLGTIGAMLLIKHVMGKWTTNVADEATPGSADKSFISRVMD